MSKNNIEGGKDEQRETNGGGWDWDSYGRLPEHGFRQPGVFHTLGCHFFISHPILQIPKSVPKTIVYIKWAHMAKIH